MFAAAHMALAMRSCSSMHEDSMLITQLLAAYAAAGRVPNGQAGTSPFCGQAGTPSVHATCSRPGHAFALRFRQLTQQAKSLGPDGGNSHTATFEMLTNSHETTPVAPQLQFLAYLPRLPLLLGPQSGLINPLISSPKQTCTGPTSRGPAHTSAGWLCWRVTVPCQVTQQAQADLCAVRTSAQSCWVRATPPPPSQRLQQPFLGLFHKSATKRSPRGVTLPRRSRGSLTAH